VTNKQRPLRSGLTAASVADDVLKGIDLSGMNAVVTAGHVGLGFGDHACPQQGPALIRGSRAIVDRDLKLVTATSHAWRWIARLGLATTNDAEPLPGFIYAMLARLAHAAQPDQQRGSACRPLTALGRWYARHR
jgi:hypothetical protein